MISEEQKAKIRDLSIKYAPLKEGFPKWDPSEISSINFPDTNDLKAIAEKVEPISFQLHSDNIFTSPKTFCKFVFVRFCQPMLRLIFKRQMFFNEYMWLLSNTVAMQNQKIISLEVKLNEIQKKYSN
jgi:hypothetical protein